MKDICPRCAYTAEPRDFEVRVHVGYRDYGTETEVMVRLKDGRGLGVAWRVEASPAIAAANLRLLAEFLENAAR